MGIDYNNLITSFLSGNATSEEETKLNEWISQDPGNALIFNEMQKTWIASSTFSTSKRFSSSHALQRIQPILTNSGYKYNAIIGFRQIWKVAAILIFIFMAGGLLSFFITRSAMDGNKGTCYFEAPIGSRAVAILPDGSKVWLNAGSRIEYSTDFNKHNREIILSGEGYFKVKTNPSKPFYVKTENISIKATGTSFNVKAYPGEKQVTTTLVEGKVEINGKGLNNQKFTFFMKPKQKVTYFKDDKLFAAVRSEKQSVKALPVERKEERSDFPLLTKAPIISSTNVKLELYTSWKDERWIIESEKLNDLAILFERRYNVVIHFDNEELKNYRFSGTIQNETIEQIFDIMRLTLPISYKAEKGTIWLKTDKTLKNKYRAAYKMNNY